MADMNDSQEFVRPWTALTERLADCGRALRGEMAPALTAVGLSESEFSLLWLLRDQAEGPWHQRMLAERLTVSAAHVSTVVEALRERGLVHSRRLHEDRRRQCWELSATGSQLLADLLANLSTWAASREAAFGGRNRARLCALLDELAEVCRCRAAAPAGKEAA
jgi:DNA-binding MarR family transcriptional regulator